MPIKNLYNFFDRRKIQIIKVWHDMSSSLWFRPVSWMVFSILLASVLVSFDNAILVDDFWSWAPWFLRGNASGARTMLGSISSAVLTVTSLAFSLMMVTVVQTANAYSPRIIGQYLSDRHNQNVLGVLLGTFLYSLLVLRAVNDDFVPLLAVNVAILFAVLSTVALVSFINNVAQSLKVSNIAEQILSQTEKVIEDGFPNDVGQPWSLSTAPIQPTVGRLIYAETSGYLQLVDGRELLEIAREANAVIQLLYTMGDHILAGAPIAEVWPGEAADADLADAVRSTLAIGRERTDTQDARFGVRQLVDIALRALSPGVNDPTTATDMINALKRILAAKLKCGHVSHLRADAQGNLRLILPVQTLDALLDEAFVEIFHYGGEDFAAMTQMIKTMGQLRYLAVDEEDQEALWRFLSRIVAIANKRIVSELELTLLNETLQATTAVFERDLEMIQE